MTIDLFCQVVDNYGDIGVCWRLAQQLNESYPVRLWVDDLSAFARIEHHIDPTATTQIVNTITVLSWELASKLQPAPIVIEAFGCDLPADYLGQMPQHTQLWLNLEYLSAETWVEELHLLPSPQPNGISKYFFFPGFTAKTGGLLRPSSYNSASTSTALPAWQSMGLSAPTTDRIAFVFPYPNAPLSVLYEALAQHPESWTVLLAATAPDPQLSSYQKERLTIQRLGFIQQADFDALMDYADLNIMRGEDSFVRAIWAAKPFIWQPYLQEQNTHLEKLQAWLTHTPFDRAIQQLIYDWSSLQLNADQLLNHLLHLSDWQQQCRNYAHNLCLQDNLATQLIAFCSQKCQKAVK